MIRLFVLLAPLTLCGCAHATPPTCPKAAQPESAQARTQRDQEPASPTALSLFDVRWSVTTSDSGVPAQVPEDLHTFTVGRWECALSAVRTDDAFDASRVDVSRTRRLACTHATGIVAQSALSCAFEIPSTVEQGHARRAARHLELSLSDGPAFKLACEPFAVERLVLRSREASEPARELCVRGGLMTACEPGPR